MEAIDTLILIRGLERLLTVVAGIVALVLAALLYRWGVSGEASLSLQQDKNKLQLANASPGILFALFGAVLLGWGLFRPLIIEREDIKPLADAEQAVASPGQRLRIEYADQSDPLREFLEKARGSNPELDPDQVRRQLEALKSQAGELLRKP